jgi:hypothetical protein
MAPEQWERPTEVDHRADIYALGVLLYELLTGELPLGRFDPPSVKARVDARIDELVLRALAKEPARRFQHASDVKLALEGIGRTPARGWCGTRRSTGYYEYKSATTFLGLPLVHIVRGNDPVTGLPKVARGVLVAVGDGGAVGVVAVGGPFAVGVVAIGGIALGLLAFGGVAVGVVAALGGGAAGGLLAVGGAAASAGLAIGGAAVGQFAIGGTAGGEHVIAGTRNDPDFWTALTAFFQKGLQSGFTDW